MIGASEKRELKPTEPFWKTSEPSRPSDALPAQREAEPDPRPRNSQIEARTLVVGAGMSVSGTITSCDRLVAEGTVDAKLDGCQQVIVAQTGVFRGNVSTDHADVHGRFEGELVVQKRLLVRAAGQVSGTVSYGEIEIECGGRISGQIKPQEDQNGTSSSRPAQAAKSPLSGSAQETGLPRPIGGNGSVPHVVAASSPTLASGD
ncbi:MAG: polymer-forming cytoskeletal protein [Alphaproteobacteria bacterium]|nr:MAG: polymer-forming cytoskeletal protein [Alphaproteobacteria bacterium]